MKCSRKCSGEIWESAPSLTVTLSTLLACCSCAIDVILRMRSLMREDSCILFYTPEFTTDIPSAAFGRNQKCGF